MKSSERGWESFLPLDLLPLGLNFHSYVRVRSTVSKALLCSNGARGL